jgi:hypothetical protein
MPTAMGFVERERFGLPRPSEEPILAAPRPVGSRTEGTPAKEAHFHIESVEPEERLMALLEEQVTLMEPAEAQAAVTAILSAPVCQVGSREK